MLLLQFLFYFLKSEKLSAKDLFRFFFYKNGCRANYLRSRTGLPGIYSRFRFLVVVRNTCTAYWICTYIFFRGKILFYKVHPQQREWCEFTGQHFFDGNVESITMALKWNRTEHSLFTPPTRSMGARLIRSRYTTTSHLSYVPESACIHCWSEYWTNTAWYNWFIKLVPLSPEQTTRHAYMSGLPHSSVVRCAPSKLQLILWMSGQCTETGGNKKYRILIKWWWILLLKILILL